GGRRLANPPPPPGLLAGSLIALRTPPSLADRRVALLRPLAIGRRGRAPSLLGPKSKTSPDCGGEPHGGASRQPPSRLGQPVSPAARAQPRGLVPVGRAG